MSTIPLNYVTRVLRYMRPHWNLGISSIVVTILGALAALLAPWPLKIVVDNVLEKRPLSHWPHQVLGTLATNRVELLVAAVVFGLLVALLSNGLTVINNYVNTKIEQFITLDFRSHLFLHAQKMSLAFHDRRRSGMLIYMINSQGDAPAGLILTFPMLAESALTLLGMFYISFSMDWELSVISGGDPRKPFDDARHCCVWS
jgi:ATP-binding cassette, subfamily B, bacterial